MLDVEAAMKLKKSEDILRACHEAEQRNCEQADIRRLYRLYYATVHREQKRQLWKDRARGEG